MSARPGFYHSPADTYPVGYPPDDARTSDRGNQRLRQGQMLPLVLVGAPLSVEHEADSTEAAQYPCMSGALYDSGDGANDV